MKRGGRRPTAIHTGSNTRPTGYEWDFSQMSPDRLRRLAKLEGIDPDLDDSELIEALERIERGN